MIELRKDLSVDDLVYMTAALHKVMPISRGYAVIGVEEAQEGDTNMVFHASRMGAEPGTDDRTFILAYEHILNYFGEVEENPFDDEKEN